MPIALRRLLLHFNWRRWRRQTPYYTYPLGWWIIELLFRIFDVLFIPQLVAFFFGIFRKGDLLTNRDDSAAIFRYYQTGALFSGVKLYPRAYFPKRFQFAYVSFNWINFWGHISSATLVHELAHVIQYHQMGSVYIPRALFAQHFGRGYGYLGAKGLKAWHEAGGSIYYFNLEQEASIFEHYFSICNDLRQNDLSSFSRHLLISAGSMEEGLRYYEYAVAALRQKYITPPKA